MTTLSCNLRAYIHFVARERRFHPIVRRAKPCLRTAWQGVRVESNRLTPTNPLQPPASLPSVPD